MVSRAFSRTASTPPSLSHSDARNEQRAAPPGTLHRLVVFGNLGDGLHRAGRDHPQGSVVIGDSQRNRSPGSVVRLRHQVFDPRTQSTPPAGSPLDAYAATGQA